MNSAISILFISVLWIYFLSNDVSADLDTEGIIGGRDTKPDEFPYMVAYYVTDDLYCGGGIIDEQYILTAAHCLMLDDVNFRNYSLKVILGINRLNDTNSTSRVEIDVETAYIPQVYNHSYWFNSDTPEGDIAVLKLKDRIDINGTTSFTILDLPELNATTKTYDSYINATATIVGFGYDYIKVDKFPNGTEVESGNSSLALHQANVSIVSNSVCSASYTPPVLNSQICAAIIENNNNTVQGTCSGDSGSPLVIGNTVIGLVSSSSIGCNDNNVPSLYTRVTSWVDFINNVLNGNTTGAQIHNVS